MKSITTRLAKLETRNTVDPDAGVNSVRLIRVAAGDESRSDIVALCQKHDALNKTLVPVSSVHAANLPLEQVVPLQEASDELLEEIASLPVRTQQNCDAHVTTSQGTMETVNERRA